MRLISAAMMSSASSQLMRRYLLMPRLAVLRSPLGSQSTRMSGYGMRFFEYVEVFAAKANGGMSDFMPGSSVTPRPSIVQ